MRDTTHWARLLAYVTGLVSQELLLQNEYLAALPPKGDALALQHTLPLIEAVANAAVGIQSQALPRKAPRDADHGRDGEAAQRALVD